MKADIMRVKKDYKKCERTLCMDICIAYNIQRSIHLITYSRFMEINYDMKMCSFDIDNIYSNTPKSEVTNRI
jgi:hypothetical protein